MQNLYKATGRDGKLHLFSIYTDFGASRRVKWVVSAVAKLAGPRFHCSTELWKLDSLMTNEAMGKMLAADAANADLLIVEIGSLDQRRPELIQWLASLTPLEPDRQGLFIALLGDEEDKSEELDWTAKQLIQCARDSNRRFIWHWQGHHGVDGSDWLADSVETVMASKQSAREPMIAKERAASPFYEIPLNR